MKATLIFPKKGISFPKGKDDTISDNNLLICFTEDRHLKHFKGEDYGDGLPQMWSMKERVSIILKRMIDQ